MEFGPTDRFDIIELKGMEEHEREREGEYGYMGVASVTREHVIMHHTHTHTARKQPDSQPSGDAATGDSSDKFEEFDSENPLKSVEDEMTSEDGERARSPVAKQSERVGLEKEEKNNKVHRQQQKQGGARRRVNLEEVDRDNEFMLDGFDFSTGTIVFRLLILARCCLSKASLVHLILTLGVLFVKNICTPYIPYI